MKTSLVLRRALALPLAALAAAALLACTSSGDGGVGATDDFLNAGALYESDAEPATNPWVGLTQSVDQREVFCLDVDVHVVSDLYTVAFTLAWDSSQADFRGYTLGDFLGSGILESVDATTDGQAIVGLTRQVPVHGMTGVSGSEGHLIQLCFDIKGEGSERSVDFIPNLALLDPDGDPVVGSAARWIGGRLTTALP